MDTLDSTTDFEACRVAHKYDELAAAVRKLPADRQAALMENLEVKDLEETLRAAIAKDERTHYAIAKLAGVTPDVLDRFATGERGLNLTTASKVAAVLGLHLVAGKPKKKRLVK